MVSANTGPKSDRTITRVQQVREIFFMLILQRTFQSRGLARVDCFCKRERQQQFSDALEPQRLWRRRKLSKVEKLDVSLHLPLISKFYFADLDGHSLEL